MISFRAAPSGLKGLAGLSLNGEAAPPEMMPWSIVPE